jgi:hypothetical protein
MFSAVLCSGCRGTRERSLAELLKVEEAAPFTERRLARKEKCTLQRLPHDLEDEAWRIHASCLRPTAASDSDENGHGRS